MAFTRRFRSLLVLQLTVLLLCSIVLRSLSSPIPLRSIGDSPSAYEVLQGFNFPIGLLPKGVTGYDLNESNGRFSAYLTGSCSFSLEGSYNLKYKSTIKGYISNGKLTSLEGVSVKLFWFWVDIVEVSRKGDALDFSVGIASAGFPLDNFEECPQCGCGLDCVNGHVKKLRTNPFLYEALSSS